MEAIQIYLKQRAQVVEKALERDLTEMTGVPDTLREAMRYSLLAGGKRLRPILVLSAAEAVGGKEEEALPFACAVEMIHTYSLIHDDLPSMDDDDVRRGRPTNHKVFGEAMAILAGDALLTRAFGLMAQGARYSNLEPARVLALIAEGSARSGAEGMVGGQVKDIQAENRSISLEELQDVHRSKTGDLITYSIRLGAGVGGASDSQLEALTGFAERLGLAFQIQDDVLDVIGDQEAIGKPVGSDESKNKSTYPALLGLEESRNWVRRLVAEAKDLLASAGGMDDRRLTEIADYLTVRDR
ncbi:polyprenyl synthetase family protein [Desmospora profundinema]|uniref:Geranylgeranyl diphosphate synthase type II n=1 Tax=Desmospora profundinema TaxID=1571184 RepID=A0ABU1IIQ7_9BACL|nr:farnesyl diphosphate synthase [Desmospora profundinema]MDR6224645.1 geranylgeranyl diphosphate synthase type II [Desmospora profundinema]